MTFFLSEPPPNCLQEIMEAIPRRLQGELAVQLHMANLKRVELFAECEPSLLYEFVLRLHMHMYGPDDFLCRVGEVAKVGRVGGKRSGGGEDGRTRC